MRYICWKHDNFYKKLFAHQVNIIYGEVSIKRLTNKTFQTILFKTKNNQNLIENNIRTLICFSGNNHV